MSVFETIYEVCQELDHRRIPYELRIVRPEAIMVSVAVPGERWELEYFEDGRIEVERFRSQGVESKPEALQQLLGYFDEMESG
jgi:hypothetical protein